MMLTILLKKLEENPEIITLPAFFGVDPILLAEWHPYRAGAYENETVVSDIPILVANGNLDPITPTANAVEAAKSLSISHLISFELEGHNLFIPCFIEISKTFLDLPEEMPNLDCIKDIPGIFWN